MFPFWDKFECIDDLRNLAREKNRSSYIWERIPEAFRARVICRMEIVNCDLPIIAYEAVL